MDNGRVCPQCGRSNSSTVKFCENCGYAFPVETAPQTDSANAAPQGGFGAAPQVESANAAPQQGGFGVAPQADTASAAPQQSSFNSAPQTGSFGAAPQTENANTAPQQSGFGAAPQQNSFNSAPQTGSFGAAPQQNSFNAAPQQNSFNAAPQQGGFGAAPQQNSFNSAPQQNSFNSAPQQNSFNAAPQNNFAQTPAGGAATPPKKKGGAGLIIALVAVVVLLIGGGLGLCFAFGVFGGHKTIEVSDSKVTIKVGEEAEIAITNFDTDLKKVHLEYASEDKKIAAISSEFDDGFRIEGISEGKTTITVSGKGCDDVTIKVTVKEAAPEPTPEPTDAPEPTDEPEPTDKPEPTERPEPTATSGKGSATINAEYSSDSFTIYAPDGYTVVQDDGSYLEFESEDGDYFWVYGEMQYNPYYCMHPEEMSDDMDPIPDDYSFDYDVAISGAAPNGEDLYMGYAVNPDDPYGYEELYYIFFPYDDSYGTQDYIVIEMTPELADKLDESEMESFFYGF
ncbi:MAG: zinc-ribbon domain-containing protein [Lachnospiraceae bacterium]|nr:zinc-ribbon domain-containing protein [Lachnospiraceae bacterium]